MNKTRKTLAGAKAMKAAGHRRIELWLDEALFDRVADIARSECKTRARLLKELIENWAFGFQFLTTKQLAELAKKELNNERF